MNLLFDLHVCFVGAARAICLFVIVCLCYLLDVCWC